ncbi:MAG: hypothetical protein WC992_00115 [Acholeplasmataceae bacterium]|jgi:hypothetical protein
MAEETGKIIGPSPLVGPSADAPLKLDDATLVGAFDGPPAAGGTSLTWPDGWLWDNLRRPYPFLDILSDNRELEALIADAVIVLPDRVLGDGEPVTLTYLSLDDLESPAVQFLLAGETLLTSGEDGVEYSYEVTESGEWLILQWSSSTVVAKLVCNVTALSAYPAWPVTCEAALTPSAVIPQIAGLAGVSVETEEGQENITAGPVILSEGYNCRLRTQEETRDVTGQPERSVIVDFEAGEGLGRFTRCQSKDDAIYTINGVAGDEQGRFFLTGDDCFIVRPIVGGLSLYNACTACCDCEDMAASYRAAKLLMDSQQTTIVPKLYNSRGYLWDAVRDFYIVRGNVSTDVSVLLRIFCRGSYSQSVQAVVVNRSKQELEDVLLVFTTYTDNGTSGIYVAGSGAIIGPDEEFTLSESSCAFGPFTKNIGTVAARSWRGFQYETLLKPSSLRADAITVFATVSTAYAEDITESCGIVKPVTREDIS